MTVLGALKLRPEKGPLRPRRPGLPALPVKEDEAGEHFEDVYMRHNQPMRIPVTLRVTSTHLRITAVSSWIYNLWSSTNYSEQLKATLVSNTLSCRATEIISLADISDVYNVSTGHEANEFIIRKIRHGSTLYFTSIDRDEIVKVRDLRRLV